MMTNKEYNMKRNNAYKAHREVELALEKFAKRSKHITYCGADSYYGWCRIDVIVNKDGKVVREMMEYLKNICPFYDLSDTDSAWFHNYNTNSMSRPSDEDEWVVEYEICVSYR